MWPAKKILLVAVAGVLTGAVSFAALISLHPRAGSPAAKTAPSAPSPWANPLTHRKTMLPMGWKLAKVDNKGYIFNNATAGVTAAFVERDAPKPVDLKAYGDGWAHSMGKTTALTSLGVVPTRGHPSWLGMGHSKMVASQQVTVLITQRDTQLWTLLTIGGPKDSLGSKNVTAISKALLDTLP